MAIDKSIRHGNHLPGTERYTRPEEIKALGKYLRAGIKTRDELLDLEEDNLMVPGEPQFHEKTELSKTYETINGDRLSIPNLSRDWINVNNDSSIPNLPDSSVQLDVHGEIELEKGHLSISPKEIHNLDTDLEEKLRSEDLENLDKTRLDLDGKKRVTLSDSKEKIRTGEPLEKLSREKVDLEKKNKNIALEEKPEKLRGTQEEESRLSRVYDIVPGKKLRISELPDDSLEITQEKEINRLSGYSEELKKKKSNLELSEFSSKIEERDLKKLSEEVVLGPKENEVDLIFGSQKLEDSRNLRDLPEEAEELDDPREIEIEKKRLDLEKGKDISLSDLVEKLRDNIEEPGLSKTREDIESKAIKELSSEKIDLDPGYSETKLSSEVLQIDQKKTSDLSSILSTIIDDRDIDLEDDLLEISGQDISELGDYSEKIYKNDDLELYDKSENIEKKDLSNLSGVRETLSAEKDSPELSDEVLNITREKDVQLSTVREELDASPDIDSLSDLKETLESNDQESLSTIREGLDASPDVDSLSTLRENIESKDQDSLSTIRKDIKKADELNLSNIRKDIEKSPEVSLSDIKENIESKEQDSLSTIREDLEKSPEASLNDIKETIEDERDLSLSDKKPSLEDQREVSLSEEILKVSQKEDPALSTEVKSIEKPKEVSLSDIILREKFGKDVELSNNSEQLQNNNETYKDSFDKKSLEWLNLEDPDLEKLSQIKQILSSMGEWGDKVDIYLTNLLSGTQGNFIPESKTEAYKNLFKAIPDFEAEKIYPDSESELSTELRERPEGTNSDILGEMTGDKFAEFSSSSKQYRPDSDTKEENDLSQQKFSIEGEFKEISSIDTSEKSAVEVPKYKAPNIVKNGISGLLRLVAENTLGKLGRGATKSKLITETLLLLDYARDQLEKLSESRKYRLPGNGSLGALGKVAGMVSTGVTLQKGLTAAAGMFGDSRQTPYNRPQKKHKREKWVAPGQEFEDSEVSSPVNKKKGFGAFISGVVTNLANNVLGGDKDGDPKVSGSETRKWTDMLGTGQKVMGSDGLSDFGTEISKQFLLSKAASEAKSFDEFREKAATSRLTTPEKFTSTKNTRNYFSLDSNHIWEIIMRPYIGELNGSRTWLPSFKEIDLENKSAFNITTNYGSGWLPITGFELQSKKMTSKELPLSNGNIMFPVGMEHTNELRISFADDSLKSLRRYFDMASRASIYMSNIHLKGDDPVTAILDGRIAPANYKNVSFLVDIFVMTPQLATISRTQLLCVIKDFTFESQGDIDSAPTELAINFSVVGEWPMESAGNTLIKENEEFTVKPRNDYKPSFAQSILNNLGGAVSGLF